MIIKMTPGDEQLGTRVGQTEWTPGRRDDLHPNLDNGRLCHSSQNSAELKKTHELFLSGTSDHTY